MSGSPANVPWLEAHATVFNLGPGEIIVLILLGVIYLGPGKLPDLTELLRSRVSREVGTTPRWSVREWLLISGVLLLGTLAIALGAARG